MPDTQAFAANKQACEQAEVVLDLIAESMVELSTQRGHAVSQRFLATIAVWLWGWLDDCNKPHPVTPPPPPPMTDEESRAFEKKRFTFGKFRDAEISSVPFSYLEWFVDLPETDLKLQIRRYLDSPRIKLEREREGWEI